MNWPEFWRWMSGMQRSGWEIDGIQGEGIEPGVQNFEIRFVRKEKK